VLRRVRLPRWLRFALPPLVLALGTLAALLCVLARDGVSVLEVLWSLACTYLVGLAGTGAWIAVLGWRRGEASRGSEAQDASRTDEAALPRSVVCLPVYEEDPERVFAAVAAMRESLAATEGGEAFEIFVLSDSRDVLQAAREERAFRRVAALPGPIPVYYRRRTRNARHKAGNLAEFFERWAARYTYAVVLDADSLMTGDTMVTLARRMHREPRLAILQAPLALHAGTTLLARVQQLAASLCGPLLTRGLARASGPHGNYFGHNAVLRVRAFLECCALPTLAGAPPLGGDILSHDFVEAALLCRAGWHVRIASDLDGSWEESPPTLQAYVARDRRWCQGNLQHLRVALSEGFAPMSRLHMLLGAGFYLASPAWLVFVALSLGLAARQGALLPALPGQLLCGVSVVLLLAPHLLGLADTLRDARRRAAHGGGLRASASLAAELAFGALISPLLMLHHTAIVLSVLAGRAVRWGKQVRRAQGKAGGALRAGAPVTLLGASVLGVLLAQAPQYLAWLAPLWLPWLAAIAITGVANSERAGRALARLGLLTVPSELAPHELLARADELRALTGGDDAASFRDLVLDPLLVHAQLVKLQARAPAAQPGAGAENLTRLRERALRMGPASLGDAERARVASDPDSLLWLHREAWRHWPVESWNLARDRPLTPCEPLTSAAVAGEAAAEASRS
jgi:membrane glycosyltransferase